MKTVARLMGGVLLAGAAFAAPVQAQTSFTTEGAFTGGGSTCNNPIFATIATCTFGGFTLTFNSEQGVLVGDGGVSSLGNFTLVGSGNVPAISPSTFFAIMINQTAPTVGSRPSS